MQVQEIGIERQQNRSCLPSCFQRCATHRGRTWTDDQGQPATQTAKVGNVAFVIFIWLSSAVASGMLMAKYSDNFDASDLTYTREPSFFGPAAVLATLFIATIGATAKTKSILFLLAFTGGASGGCAGTMFTKKIESKAAVNTYNKTLSDRQNRTNALYNRCVSDFEANPSSYILPGCTLCRLPGGVGIPNFAMYMRETNLSICSNNYWAARYPVDWNGWPTEMNSGVVDLNNPPPCPKLEYNNDTRGYDVPGQDAYSRLIEKYSGGYDPKNLNISVEFLPENVTCVQLKGWVNQKRFAYFCEHWGQFNQSAVTGDPCATQFSVLYFDLYSEDRRKLLVNIDIPFHDFRVSDSNDLTITAWVTFSGFVTSSLMSLYACIMGEHPPSRSIRQDTRSLIAQQEPHDVELAEVTHHSEEASETT